MPAASLRRHTLAESVRVPSAPGIGPASGAFGTMRPTAPPMALGTSAISNVVRIHAGVRQQLDLRKENL